MSETLNQIPPEAWPLIDLLFNLTMAATGIWLAITVFVIWRRASSNLTPVNAAGKSGKAQPDFLKVDKKARAEALERGEAFDKELERREREAAKAEARGKRKPASLGQRIASLASFFMSLFTLATLIFGAIFQVSRMGQMMKDYSAPERIIAVIEAHPISFTIATLVIVHQVYRFISDRKWQEG